MLIFSLIKGDSKLSRKKGSFSNKKRNNFNQRDDNSDSPPENNYCSKIEFEPKTINQKNYFHSILKNDITIAIGPAGCGKTLVAICAALQNIMSKNPTFEKLVIVRSVLEACDENIGFLSGDSDEKLMHLLLPIIDNLKVFLNDGQIELLIKRKQIEIIHLGHLRGRSLNNCVILCEEAQNLNPEKMLMILTRMGEDSKVIVSGDLGQSDLKSHEKNGLADAIERLEGMENVAICKLDHNDIQRNGMISEILYKYDKLPDIDKSNEIEN